MEVKRVAREQGSEREFKDMGTYWVNSSAPCPKSSWVQNGNFQQKVSSFMGPAYITSLYRLVLTQPWEVTFAR